ncbi:hypothetical protein GW17_00035730 [Ensete ventricosum]|nr:hypothetical protein GW17_00035730 [Ensete ventricosum]RZR86783.1 hypothetical protein BHM03_00014038 [Ensete ventricosum]
MRAINIVTRGVGPGELPVTGRRSRTPYKWDYGKRNEPPRRYSTSRGRSDPHRQDFVGRSVKVHGDGDPAVAEYFAGRLPTADLSISIPVPANPVPRGGMKRLIRRLSRVADSSLYCPLQTAKGGQRVSKGEERRQVPEGHVPVCVGEEMERFAVPAELLGRPAFLELLRRSAQEYGYEQRGVLRIPCPVPLFRRLLLLSSYSSSGAAAVADPALEELFRSLPDEDRSPAASPT